MRLLGCLIAAVCISFLNSPCAHAQTANEHSADAESETAHKHRDTHHGHDHIYPDRGAIYRELPRGGFAVHHAGLSYKFSDGVWFESRGQAFIVVAPAIGAVVTALPAFATQVDKGAPAAATTAPAASSTLISGTSRGTKVVAYPKNGQSPDVQARDHYECHRFAVANSGFDPMHVSGASAAAQVAEQQSDYERAQAACFEGRGYSIH